MHLDRLARNTFVREEEDADSLVAEDDRHGGILAKSGAWLPPKASRTIQTSIDGRIAAPMVSGMIIAPLIADHPSDRRNSQNLSLKPV